MFLTSIDIWRCSNRKRIIDNLRTLPFAPSVQMQSVPGASVGKATGVGTTAATDDDVDFELDAKIRGKPSVI